MLHGPRLAPAFLLGTLAAISLTQLTGCSSSSKSTALGATSTISMSALTPATATLQAGAQEQFAITVTGATDTSVNWNIIDGNGTSHYSGDSTVGTISATGLYQAPAATAALTLTLYAAATANTSISRTATLTINPPPQPVSVSISPTNATVSTCPAAPCGSSSTRSFSAVVSHASDTSVVWQVNGVLGGNPIAGLISDEGLYTGPAAVPNPATVTVTALSNADPTKTASAAVAISEAGSLSVSLNQSTVSLTSGGSFDFTATISPSSTPDPAVTWSRTCGVADCGTITPTGVDSATYVAPSNVSSTLQVSVMATLDVDSTKSASAGVAVMSPVAPGMTIVGPSSAVSASGTATLTATFVGVDDTPAPTITWPAVGAPATFCVSTDEEGAGHYDNCGQNDDGNDGDDPPGNEPDGPGKVAGTGAFTATYTAPSIIYTSIVQGGNLCTQPTTQNPAWVYVPVTATARANGAPVQLTASTCIQLVPHD